MADAAFVASLAAVVAGNEFDLWTGRAKSAAAGAGAGATSVVMRTGVDRLAFVVPLLGVAARAGKETDAVEWALVAAATLAQVYAKLASGKFCASSFGCFCTTSKRKGGAAD